MKKMTRTLLLGVGIAAAGAIAYSLWDSVNEPVVVQDADSVPTTPSKEYVERRRQQMRDTAQAKTVEEPSPEESSEEGTACASDER